MATKICRECGQLMQSRVIAKGGQYKVRLERFECSNCGYQESKERTSERMANDSMDEETQKGLKGEPEEPFFDPEQNEE